MTILIFLTSKPSLFLLNLHKKPSVYRKHFQKIVLLHLKIVRELRKNLSSFFSSHQVYSVRHSVIKKNHSAMVPHLFFTNIYCAVHFGWICL